MASVWAREKLSQFIDVLEGAKELDMKVYHTEDSSVLIRALKEFAEDAEGEK